MTCRLGKLQVDCSRGCSLVDGSQAHTSWNVSSLLSKGAARLPFQKKVTWPIFCDSLHANVETPLRARNSPVVRLMAGGGTRKCLGSFSSPSYCIMPANRTCAHMAACRCRSDKPVAKDLCQEEERLRKELHSLLSGPFFTGDFCLRYAELLDTLLVQWSDKIRPAGRKGTRRIVRSG